MTGDVKWLKGGKFGCAINDAGGIHAIDVLEPHNIFAMLLADRV